MAPRTIVKSRHEYTVAWIAALPIERASVIVMLDKEHGKPKDFQQPSSDKNSYSWGSLYEHNIVVVSLASSVYGTTMAAVTVVELLGSFPLIKFGLLVGIGAGIPRNNYDVRLGDVVVGYPSGSSGGIIQYDLGKAKTDGAWERKDMLNRPPEILLKALGNLQAKHEVKASKITQFITEAAEQNPKWAEEYTSPDKQPDRFFKSEYEHIANARDCLDCAVDYEIVRPQRNSASSVIHYGVIASGNSLVKDAETRDKIAQFNDQCICLEMEAAGIVNSLPCMVVRGICDYADSHKNDHWQRYAAACAAAFAKELMECVPNLEQAQFARISGRRGALLKRGKIEEDTSDEEDEEARLYIYKRKDLAKRVAQLLPKLYICPYADRKNRNIKRIPNTCEWFTNHDRFKYWRDNSKSTLLWVSADPGCGKSVLARYLVDEVLPAPDRIVCYFFFKDDSIDERRSATALCSLLHQLLKQKPGLHQHPAIENMLMHGERFVDTFWDLWNAFIAIVTDKEAVGEVVCVLDALDECTELDRDDLMKAINDLDFTAEKRGSLKILLTSRPYDYMRRGFYELESRMPIIHLSGEGEEEVARIRDEIGLVIEHMVQQIGLEKNLTSNECELLLKQLTAVENRTYLWVHITIDILRKTSSFDRKTVQQTFTEIPQSLDAAYEKILRECLNETKARQILGAILVAQEPLFVDEIALILALRDSHKSFSDLEVDLESSSRMAVTIRDLCGLFVVINDNKVYFLHQTAREFLLGKMADSKSLQATPMSSIALSTPAWKWKQSFVANEYHLLLASACVRFLRFKDLPAPTAHVFQNYAPWYWNIHMNEAALTMTDDLTTLALDLCKIELRDNWLQVLRRYAVADEIDVEEDTGPTDQVPTIPDKQSPELIIAVWTGVTALVQAHLSNPNDINAVDANGRTALSWAAAEGHEAIAQILLDRGAKTDGKNLYSKWNPLQEATSRNQIAMVKLLLKNAAKIDGSCDDGTQAIHFAAEYGYKEMVLFLLSKGVDVNAKDATGASPLIGAAYQGHLDMVELLLKNGAILNYRPRTALTVLATAVTSSNEMLVKLLLKKGADINYKDRYGFTALMSASEGDSVSMVQLLLSHGASIHVRDIYGKNALIYSSGQGQPDIVKALLDHGADIASKDEKNETALFRAADYGRDEIANLLIDKGVQLDAINNHGQTALFRAVWEGHQDFVTTVLSRGANVNIRDFNGDMCLHMLARNKQHSVEILKILIKAGADLTAVDYQGRTPVLAALLRGHDSLVRCFLEQGFGINEVTGFALEPSLLKRDYRNIVRNTLYRTSFPSNIWQGWTLLHAAAFQANPSLTGYLLGEGASIDSIDNCKRTPLFWGIMGSVDNLTVRLEDGLSFEIPFVWTRLGIRKPLPMIGSSKFQLAREARLKELYPLGYTSAQLKTVALLLAHGANPILKGIHWRYSLMPGLNRYKKERQEMFDLLKGTKEQALAVANRIPDGAENLTASDADSMHEKSQDSQNLSQGFVLHELDAGRQPSRRRLEDIIEGESSKYGERPGSSGTSNTSLISQRR